MTDQLLTKAVEFIESDMQEGIFSRLGKGTVVVYSSRSPDKKSVNEDAAAIIPIYDDTSVLVVADGVGGQPGGAQASSLAIKELLSVISVSQNDTDDLRDTILSAIEQANQKVIAHGTGSATTLAVVEIKNSHIRPYHVGDSMILLTGQRGRVKLETVSHSPVGYAVESGIISESDAFEHEERHIVSNIVGSPEMHISIGIPTKLAKRDTLLIATDGLFDNLQKNEIIEIIRKGPLNSCAQELIKYAHERMTHEESLYKPDDMTFILFRPVNHI